ncbi:hypothetical protein C8R46DRAFT_1230593 [Mycena filopes]|nr:hypothetical protein C8R46DRAFT_1230593 [Mycena filopes]
MSFPTSHREEIAMIVDAISALPPIYAPALAEDWNRDPPEDATVVAWTADWGTTDSAGTESNHGPADTVDVDEFSVPPGEKNGPAKVGSSSKKKAKVTQPQAPIEVDDSDSDAQDEPPKKKDAKVTQPQVDDSDAHDEPPKKKDIKKKSKGTGGRAPKVPIQVNYDSDAEEKAALAKEDGPVEIVVQSDQGFGARQMALELYVSHRSAAGKKSYQKSFERWWKKRSNEEHADFRRLGTNRRRASQKLENTASKKKASKGAKSDEFIVPVAPLSNMDHRKEKRLRELKKLHRMIDLLPEIQTNAHAGGESMGDDRNKISRNTMGRETQDTQGKDELTENYDEAAKVTEPVKHGSAYESKSNEYQGSSRQYEQEWQYYNESYNAPNSPQWLPADAAPIPPFDSGNEFQQNYYTQGGADEDPEIFYEEEYDTVETGNKRGASVRFDDTVSPKKKVHYTVD